MSTIHIDQYCCKEFSRYFENDGLGVFYSGRYRRYGIIVRGHNAMQVIDFCPWCGQKLPGSLQDAWEKDLIGMGLNEREIYDADENIPLAYRSNRWWREKIESGIELIQDCNDEHDECITKNNLDIEDHCCNIMSDTIEDSNTYICVLPHVREYGIGVIGKMDEMERIYFCPWCGTKLPNSLRNEWYRMIWNPSRKEFPWLFPIPEEYTSDAWWKK